MPIYISRGRFTSDAVKGMLAKPENREEAVAKLFKSVGGKLIGWYLTFGHHDWLAIGEFKEARKAHSRSRRGAGAADRNLRGAACYFEFTGRAGTCVQCHPGKRGAYLRGEIRSDALV